MRVLCTGITFARCKIEYYCAAGVGVKSVQPFYGHVTQSVTIAVNGARWKNIWGCLRFTADICSTALPIVYD